MDCRSLAWGWLDAFENKTGVGMKRKVRTPSTVICCDKTDGGAELREISTHLDALGVAYSVGERRTHCSA